MNKNLLKIRSKNVSAGRLGFWAFLTFFLSAVSFAQSTNQSSPTPIITNEINGTIRARDIGDSRLTNHYYAFNGNQGDVFINVVTQNLNGDIDIFTLDGLRPLTKITVFADVSDSETGRVVYLRRSEKLLLRVQGRSPNDDPATYRIKFAGSFLPMENVAGNEVAKMPEVSERDRGEVKVNSVGTIIEETPRPAPSPETVADNKNPEPAEKVDERPEKNINVTSVDEKNVSDSSAKIEIRREPVEKTDAPPEENPARSKPVVVVTDLPELEKTGRETRRTNPATREVTPVDPGQLANIKLIIRFKDGQTIKYPLNRVFSFNVNQGILRVVLSDGKVSRYSMLDVEKVSIEEEIEE
ncbi:MAG: hypothetical protein R2747_05760 [Pyrinomonadaceae bacterium]